METTIMISWGILWYMIQIREGLRSFSTGIVREWYRVGILLQSSRIKWTIKWAMKHAKWVTQGFTGIYGSNVNDVV